MIGLRRGMGSTNVQAIAQAQRSGQLANLAFDTEYFQPAYTAAGELEPLPSYLYMEDSGAGLMASLLNGSVFEGNPPGNYQVAAGSQLPPANWIRLSDGGTVLPGNLIQPGTVLAFQDVCDAERYFADAVPGGILSSDCAGESNPLVEQNGMPAPPLPIAVAPVPVSSTPLSSMPAQSNGSSPLLANPTPVPGAPPATNPPAANGTPAAISDWTSIFTEVSFGGLPNWVWMAGVGVALFAFGGKR